MKRAPSPGGCVGLTLAMEGRRQACSGQGPTGAKFGEVPRWENRDRICKRPCGVSSPYWLSTPPKGHAGPGHGGRSAHAWGKAFLSPSCSRHASERLAAGLQGPGLSWAPATWLCPHSPGGQGTHKSRRGVGGWGEALLSDSSGRGWGWGGPGRRSAARGPEWQMRAVVSCGDGRDAPLE